MIGLPDDAHSDIMGCVGRQVYGVVPPRWRTKAEGVMLMSNVDLLNILLAVAGLVLSAYAIGRQNRR